MTNRKQKLAVKGVIQVCFQSCIQVSQVPVGVSLGFRLFFRD